MKKSECNFDKDIIVIKCAKEWHIYNLVILVLLFLMGVILYFEYSSASIAALIITPPLLILMRYWIVIGKTIIMSKESCSVQVLFGRRTYRWDELKTKKIVDFSNHIGTRQPYISGVVFSTGYVKNPFRLMPLDYNVLNVFANGSIYNYFFVNFDPQLKHNTIHPDVYVVDENEFMQVMKDWGINIEDSRKKDNERQGTSCEKNDE